MGKLEEKTALITGSDSGIGQSTAIAFACEEADVVITYYKYREGAEETLQKVEEAGRKGLILQTNTRSEKRGGIPVRPGTGRIRKTRNIGK